MVLLVILFLSLVPHTFVHANHVSHALLLMSLFVCCILACIMFLSFPFCSSKYLLLWAARRCSLSSLVSVPCRCLFLQRHRLLSSPVVLDTCSFEFHFSNISSPWSSIEPHTLEILTIHRRVGCPVSPSSLCTVAVSSGWMCVIDFLRNCRNEGNHHRYILDGMSPFGMHVYPFSLWYSPVRYASITWFIQHYTTHYRYNYAYWKWGNSSMDYLIQDPCIL